MKIKILLAIFLSLRGMGICGRAQNADDKPTIFVCGDSTAKNSGKGKNGEPVAGWGTPIAMDAEVKRRVDELWSSLKI